DDGGTTTSSAITSALSFGASRGQRIIAISSPYHMYRIEAEASRQGLAVILCPAPHRGLRTPRVAAFDVRQHLREIVPVANYAARWHARRTLECIPGLCSRVRAIRARARSFLGDADAIAVESAPISA